MVAAGDVVLEDEPWTTGRNRYVAMWDLRFTGSYNWTRGADRDNRENFLVSEEPPLVARYQHAFERLWGELRD